MEQSPSESHYDLADLGLDPSNADDMQLYIESGGLREVGALLLEKRRLHEWRMAGHVSNEEAEEFAGRLDAEIDEARRKHRETP